jgi:hypothetical protein
MAVASGDQRRRLDAIELLVGEITSTQPDWNSDCIPLAIRNALEVGLYLDLLFFPYTLSR